jgi:hypothetical protein
MQGGILVIVSVKTWSTIPNEHEHVTRTRMATPVVADAFSSLQPDLSLSALLLNGLNPPRANFADRR